MNRMQDLYGQYGQLDPQGQLDGYTQSDANMDNLGAQMVGQSQTLDQIIQSNNAEMMRRRSAYNPAQYQSNGHDSRGGRRSSMMEFGTSDLADFAFDPNPAPPQMSQNISNMMSPAKSLDPRRVRSKEELTLDTRFQQMSTNYNMNNPNASAFSPAMMGNTMGDDSNNFMNSGMEMSMDFDSMAGDVTPMATSHAMQQAMYSDSPMSSGFPVSYSSNHEPGGGHASPNTPMNTARTPHSAGPVPQNFLTKKTSMRRHPSAPMAQSPLSMTGAHSGSVMPSPVHAQHPMSRRQSIDGQSPYVNNMGEMTMEQLSQVPGVQGPNDRAYSKFQNAYSSSGFDMLGVLMRVATRRKPEINIGPVDLSCAFVVCDIDKHDLPIVYCSDMFERLTGYTRYEILGRNCRFLQAPDGKVQSGVKRKYVDDQSVLYLKNQISKRAEAQLSLINYRKGGQPFMNLLTMIPITWDTEEFRYFIGFQVDLVEQPNSVSGRNPDGTYSINYNRSSLPAYSLPPPPDPSSGLTDMGQTIPRDDVSQVLSTIGNGESELSKRIWDKVLLENTDDVVHVLSLKGLFLYLSPASRKVLEYDANELVGTPLSSICHPSDIVPVTRELKDSAGGSAVNVVYRIRRKYSGYTWFEAHGCLHTEQGKGRKCMIMVGRERPVYALDRNELTNDGAVGDSELWSKLSTSGMFLYISSNSRAMLDRVAEEMVGVSMQSLMRAESRRDFMRILESARTGEKGTFKHDLQNRRGQVLQAQTTIYPGDAKKGSKPTFVLAQTRLMKMTRAMLLQHKTINSPNVSEGNLTPNGVPSSIITSDAGTGGGAGSNTPMSEPGVVTQAGSSGLPLGNQDESLASEDNVFDELKTTRSTSWQYELRQMERQNRLLAEELQGLVSRKKKRKRRKGLGQMEKDCANCHTRVTPEWRRGPSGQRDLCNSCGLRWAKQNGRVSPRNKSATSEKISTSPAHKASTSTPRITTTATASGKSPQQGQVTSRSPLHQQQNAGSAAPGAAGQRADQPEGQAAAASGGGAGGHRAGLPNMIEEGDEPPGTRVLPA